MRLQRVASSAELGGVAGGELVARRQEHLRAETLEQRAPALIARQRGPQRTDALRGDNWNQPGLARERERPLVAGRIGFTDSGERVVLVADKQDVAPGAFGMGGDLGDPLQDGALEIELEHHAEDPGQPWIQTD